MVKLNHFIGNHNEFTETGPITISIAFTKKNTLKKGNQFKIVLHRLNERVYYYIIKIKRGAIDLSEEEPIPTSDYPIKRFS